MRRDKEYYQRVVKLLEEALAPEYREAKRSLTEKVDKEIKKEIQQEKKALESDRINIDKLAEKIEAGLFPSTNARMPRPSPSWRVGHVTPYWKGADIMIAAEPMPDYRGSKTVVVTQHAPTLALLLHRLRDACSNSLDHVSRYEFFGRIAESVNHRIFDHGDASEHEVLRTAVHEARNVLDIWLARIDR